MANLQFWPSVKITVSNRETTVTTNFRIRETSRAALAELLREGVTMAFDQQNYQKVTFWFPTGKTWLDFRARIRHVLTHGDSRNTGKQVQVSERIANLTIDQPVFVPGRPSKARSRRAKATAA